MLRRTSIVLALLALACSADRSGKSPAPPPAKAPPKSAPPPTEIHASRDITLKSGDDKPSGSGLLFELTDGQPPPAESAAPPAKKTEVRALSKAEVEPLLARLPPIDAKASDRADFAMRASTRKLPLAGATTLGKFPPEVSRPKPPAPKVEPLKIERMQPQGDVPLAPHLSITFSQPMVPVSSVDQVLAEALPANLSPKVEGQWRWAGTRTLLFEPKPRFPMATAFTVAIPAGLKSQTGGPLQEPEKYTFRTPPPRVKSFSPGGTTNLTPLMYATFDQRVDAKAVLARVTVKAGRKRVATRIATATEIEEAGYTARLAQEEERAIAFVVQRPLPKATRVEVVFEKGLPSAEGPRKTTKTQTYRFKTYGPFEFRRARCAWGGTCYPGAPFTLELTNSMGNFDAKMVKIDPPIEDVKITSGGGSIHIQGKTIGRTTYRLRVGTELEDVYGQKLVKAIDTKIAVGPAAPQLTIPGGDFMVLERTKKPSLSVYTINYDKLDVLIHKVEPKDWYAWLDYKRRHREKTAPRMPGKKVFSGVVDAPDGQDTLVETKVDLTSALTDFYGQLVIRVQPAGWKPDPKRSWYWPGAIRWVQVTNIGLDALIDHADLHTFATRLSDGAGVAAELSVLPNTPMNTTADAQGYATLALPPKSPDRSALLVAKRGDDVALLPENHWSSSSSSWIRREQSDGYRYFVFDDRGLYKPKEEVHIKGFLRRTTRGPDGDVAALGPHEGRLVYKVRDARGNEFAKGETKLSKLGGFAFDFKVPDDVNLGRAYAQFSAPGVSSKSGYSGSHSFSIQEFRKPEFEVGVTTTEGPHLVGQYGVFSAKATYYTGGPLAAADVRWVVRSNEGSYTPPNRSDFVFGTWSPWWWWGRHGRGHRPASTKSFAATTDGSGEHHLRIDLQGVEPPRPTVVSAEASVSDVNRQTWSASGSFLVHPSERYIGLKTERYFVEAGQDVEIDVVHVGLDGALAKPTDAELTFTFSNDADAEPQKCAVTKAEQTCTFTTKKGGPYAVLARTKDDRGRPNESSMTLWVSGGDNVPTSRNITEETVQLIPNKKSYAAGDVAEVLVQAPFADAEGLWSLEREGVVKTGRFTMKGTSKVLEIEVEERFTPNVHLRVILVGRQKRRNGEGKVDDTLPPRPAYAAGTMNIAVPPATRTLAIDLEPDAYEVEPGAKSRVAMTVKTADGAAAAGAEIAFYVVDEAVLALTSYATPDPLSIYPHRSNGVRVMRSRQFVYLADPEEVAQTAFAPEEDEAALGDMGSSGALMNRSARRKRAPAPAMKAAAEMAPGGGIGGGGAAPPIAVRKDFSALAVFRPSVTTDARGRAEVEFDFPDNLTRYRVIAVAAHGDNHFGVVEANITARRALMVRPSAPRFLNYGDTFELPVVLENRTGAPLSAQVVVRATNANVDAVGYAVEIPKEDRVEVRFPSSTDAPGRARFQFAAAANQYADAAEVDLPVWTPATTEAFATYGEIDKGAIVQPVVPPADVAKSFGGLQITTASTQLQALTDAYIYILDYPYGCAEQVSSRVITTAALKDVLEAFKAEGMPPKDQLVAAVGRDIKKLAQLQNSDGGWGWWRRGRPSRPFLTIHVMHALVRAQAKNFEVPKTVMNRGRQYLRDIDKHIDRAYGPGVRTTLVAFALYVRAMMGEIDGARAKKLIRSAGGVSKLPLEAAGWLYPVAVEAGALRAELAQLRRLFDNRATETAATAHFATSYQDGGHVLLHSARRVDALILEGLMRDQPKNTLIPKLVRGLLAHRTKGRWANTQESSWVLVALDRYFRQYEKLTPNFVARVWLGDQYAGDRTFEGRTTDQHLIDIPMAYLVDQPKQDLLLQKDGQGRLYYRIGLKYAPNDLMLEPASYGFEVKRTYEGVDDPNDVKRDEDGTWHFVAGARVRVKLTMINTARRYHVALVDPLPAGLEPINAALAGSGSVPPDSPEYESPWFWWRRTWYVHDNLRDERAEAFSTTLWPGEHAYSYVARATTPGRFVVPPTKAEEMYFPETFGRSGTDRVVVE